MEKSYNIGKNSESGVHYAYEYWTSAFYKSPFISQAKPIAWILYIYISFFYLYLAS